MSTPLWTNYLTQFVVAVMATVSFGITFHVPKRHYLAGGLTGAVGWMAYILCYDLLSVSAPVAVLIATLPLTLCARFFSVYHKAPVTVFLLPGIFPLVPGAGIYYTAYYFIQSNNALALSNGISTFKIAVALATGIALVLGIPLPHRRR